MTLPSPSPGHPPRPAFPLVASFTTLASSSFEIDSLVLGDFNGDGMTDVARR